MEACKARADAHTSPGALELASCSSHCSEPNHIHLYHTDKRLGKAAAGPPSTAAPAEPRSHVHIANGLSIWLLVERFVSDP